MPNANLLRYQFQETKGPKLASPNQLDMIIGTMGEKDPFPMNVISLYRNLNVLQERPFFKRRWGDTRPCVPSAALVNGRTKPNCKAANCGQSKHAHRWHHHTLGLHICLLHHTFLLARVQTIRYSRAWGRRLCWGMRWARRCGRTGRRGWRRRRCCWAWGGGGAWRRRWHGGRCQHEAAFLNGAPIRTRTHN